MRKTALITSFALATVSLALATGCQQKAPEEEVAELIPTAEQIEIDFPAQAASARAGASSHAVGDPSEFHQLTRAITGGFNLAAGWVLVVVHAIVQQPPTTVDGNVYTWGPGSDALDPADWRLVVTANDDGSYDWALDGRSKRTPEDGFFTVISGHAVPGAEPGESSGSFFVDFGAAENVNPEENDDTGSIEIAYELDEADRSGSLEITGTDVSFDGNPDTGNFTYYYSRAIDGSGDFEFSASADVDEDGSANESVAIRSRWRAGGAGRGDARVTGGDPGELDVSITECWSERFERVFYDDSAGFNPTEGEASSCAFAEAEYPAS